MKATPNTKAYIVGGGIAGLAAAVYFIREAGLAPRNIVFFEELDVLGGSLDASGDAMHGYLMRGGRMFEEHYVCTYDLLSEIPSLDDPAISARNDIFHFTWNNNWRANARLIDAAGGIIDSSKMGFNWLDRLALFKLLFLSSESSLGEKRINEVFPKHFFSSNFWLMWCTMFSFQPWHSAVEMRRYLLRFIQLFPQVADLTCVYHTRYNQLHSMIVPLQNWLNAKGVTCRTDTRVIDMDLLESGIGFRVTSLKTTRKDGSDERQIALGESDLVIFTNGSMTDASKNGDNTTPAPLSPTPLGGSWALWKTLAAKRAGFGNPDKFIRDVDGAKWLSFTATVRTPLLRKLIEGMTHMTWGREGLITFKDSSWFMTMHPHFRPVYPGQSEDVDIFWGYGLHPDAVGDYVKNKMSDCTGKELLRETYLQLHFEDHLDQLMAHSEAIPCMMPYITSQFMPRAKGDRPAVVPAGSQNLAFVGQYAEAPEDVVFTVEYSVRTAYMAVKALLEPKAKIPPVYKGQHDIGVLLAAARESLT